MKRWALWHAKCGQARPVTTAEALKLSFRPRDMNLLTCCEVCQQRRPRMEFRLREGAAPESTA